MDAETNFQGVRNKQLNMCVSAVDDGNKADDDDYDDELFPNPGLDK